MSENSTPPNDSVIVAQRIAAALASEKCEYALGGAIALGFWATPRGTLDVDVTLFVPPETPSTCVRLLQSIGCEFQADLAAQSLREHGYCAVEFLGNRVDVFVPLISFYDQARLRRKTVSLDGQQVVVWDAETLCVFKMMFFRRKDLADLEQLLRAQGTDLDADWVRSQIIDIYGMRDPRVLQWEELVRDVRSPN